MGEERIAQVAHHELTGHQHRACLQDQQESRAHHAREVESHQGGQARRAHGWQVERLHEVQHMLGAGAGLRPRT